MLFFLHKLNSKKPKRKQLRTNIHDFWTLKHCFSLSQARSKVWLGGLWAAIKNQMKTLTVACSPDSEAMGFLLQITMSCPCALSRQVAGAGAGCRCWCCELAVHVVETGCWCWCRVPVLVVLLVPVLGAGCRCWCWCCELAVHVVEAGCWCWCWC